MMQETPRSDRGSRVLGEPGRDDRGSALVMAIFVLVVLTGMGTALLFLSQNELKMTQAGVRAKKAFFLAEAGLEEARTELWHANGNGEFTDDLEIASGGIPTVPDPDGIDFDPDALTVLRDSDGNVTGFSGFDDDTPLVNFTSFSDGAYIAFLTNDPIDGPDTTTDSNDRVMVTAVGAGSDNSVEVIQAILEHGVLIPGVPPATITMIGPMASFNGGTSKVKVYNGEDCGGVGGVPGLYVPIVGAIGDSAIANAELGIDPNPTYTSGSESDAGTFANLMDPNEPTIASGYGATVDDTWRDCENWIQIVETLRLMADVICADGTELWDTCIPPPNSPDRLIFGDGNLTVPPGTHEGTVVVTGVLNMNGNADWTGLILAVGEGSYLVNGAGNGVVSGGLIVVDVAGPDQTYGTSDDCTGPGTGDNEGFDTPTFLENGGGNAGTIYCTTSISAAWPAPPYDIREFLQR